LLPRFAAIAGTYLGIAVVWLPPSRSLWFVARIADADARGIGFAIYALAHLGRSFA